MSMLEYLNNEIVGMEKEAGVLTDNQQDVVDKLNELGLDDFGGSVVRNIVEGKRKNDKINKALDIIDPSRVEYRDDVKYGSLGGILGILGGMSMGKGFKGSTVNAGLGGIVGAAGGLGIRRLVDMYKNK